MNGRLRKKSGKGSVRDHATKNRSWRTRVDGARPQRLEVGEGDRGGVRKGKKTGERGRREVGKEREELERDGRAILWGEPERMRERKIVRNISLCE